MAAAAGERVFLPAGRFAAVTLLGLPAQQLFTSDNTSARIIAMSRHQARRFNLHKVFWKHSTLLFVFLTFLSCGVGDDSVCCQA